MVMGILGALLAVSLILAVTLNLIRHRVNDPSNTIRKFVTVLGGIAFASALLMAVVRFI